MKKFEKEVNILLDPLFPEPLQLNEIKAVMIPFKYKAFRPTRRFENILNNAGPDFKMTMGGYDTRRLYFYACSFILMKYYNVPIDVSRPIFMDIPNQKTRMMRHYRALFNADYMEVTKTDKAPELTPDDIDQLLLRGEDLEFWQSKFPPDGYILKGLA